jgi:hypothetical protein
MEPAELPAPLGAGNSRDSLQFGMGVRAHSAAILHQLLRNEDNNCYRRAGAGPSALHKVA